MVKKIDGTLFADMIISGANNLCNQKSIVDNLNVFPVPDGDTGTNMSLTISAAVKEVAANREKNVLDISKILASATLRGARGNSGVILSQLMRGVNKGLTGADADFEGVAAAFKSAADTAYRAVMKPTEGTILTVARETAEAAEKYAKDGLDAVEFFEKIVNSANESLAKTQFILPQLKQAGVVDAGGKGLVCILEGALAFLKTGEIVALDESETPLKTQSTPKDVQADIKFQYCTEFLINKKAKNVDVFKFKSTIEYYGDCMLVIDDDDVVKVHIHTNTPNLVIGEALRLGELINIKIDNMRYQHDEKVITKEDKKNAEKEIGFVCVAAGAGIKKTFFDLGVDHIIEGGQTMNPSTEDMLNAIDKVNAKTIYILPNNKNIILAANQARDLTEDKKIIVIPTKTIPQGVTALISFVPEKTDDENTAEMTDAISRVQTGQITYAVRDTRIDDKEIHEGDIMGIGDKGILAVGNGKENVAVATVDAMMTEDAEVISIYYGADASEEKAEELASTLEEK